MRHLPSRPWDVMLAVAVGGAGAVDGVLELVRTRADTAVDGLDAVMAFGALPQDRGPWVDAVQGLFRR